MIILVLVVFVITRLSIAMSVDPVFDQYDSSHYFKFNLTNSFRLPVITGIYSLIQDYKLIILFQSFLSSIAWIAVMFVLQNYLQNLFLKITFFLIISLFSITQIVIFRDTYLASESLHLSLLLFVVAFIFYKTNLQFKILSIAFLLFLLAGVKNQNSFFSVPILIFFIIVTIKSREITQKDKLILSTLLFVFLFLSSYFLSMSLRDNTIATLNTAANINTRIWTEDSWREYLLNSSYPPELRTIWRDFYSYNKGLPPSEAVAREEIFNLWWENDQGKTFSITFPLKHPDYLILGPFFLPILNSKTNYSYTVTYGLAQDPNYFPRIINISNPFEVFWPSQRSTSYLFLSLLLMVLSLCLLFLNKKIEFQKFVLKVVVVHFCLTLWLILSWFAATKIGIDALRTAEAASIILRLFFISCILIVIDLHLRGKKKNLYVGS